MQYWIVCIFAVFDCLMRRKSEIDCLTFAVENDHVAIDEGEKSY